MIEYRNLLFLLLLLFGCAPAQTPPPADAWGSDVWEDDIRRFEEADRVQPPPTGGVVFVGSSSIRGWRSLSDDFPGVPVINRGFGGSEMGDAVRYASRIVLPYRPRLVIVYAGENDLNAGKTPEHVVAAYDALVRQIHGELPQTRIGFISAKPSPSRWHLEDEMRRTNDLVREYAARDPRLFYIDVFSEMLDAEGQPREELFIGDRLHMNEAGYRIWREAVRPHLEH